MGSVDRVEGGMASTPGSLPLSWVSWAGGLGAEFRTKPTEKVRVGFCHGGINSEALLT